MNPDAGRGGWLIVKVRLESGEELPFLVDTGSTATIFDESLVPKLGKCFGTVNIRHWYTNWESEVYAAPKLYLGRTPLLMTGNKIATHDLQHMSSDPDQPVIMGVLGMDVLEHYCLQLDFTAGKMRFLDDERANKQEWGKAFPLTFLKDRCPCIRGNLLGAKDACSLVDTGYNVDGRLMPEFFQLWTNQANLPTNGEARWSDGVLDGETYAWVSLTKQNIGFGGIGFLFLSRHLVSLDFPNRTMYLKPTRTSYGSLLTGDMLGCLGFLHNLNTDGRLPGFAKRDEILTEGSIAERPHYRVHYPDSVTGIVRKRGDASSYHYHLVRKSIYGPWKLQKAWRTDQDGHKLEEYPIP
jgi:hypothetical protein